MSRLQELIWELCPDGVEYKRIVDVSRVGRGVRVVRKELSDTEGYPVFQNSLTPLGYYTSFNRTQNTVYIISAGAAGDIGFCDVDFWAADDCLFIEENDSLDQRFLYHVLMSQQNMLYSRVRKASVPRLSRTVIEGLEVPVPPLEVQREIVRVLDNFTLLRQELSAELSARRKQYEYYRNQMLQFDSGTKRIALGDLFDFRNGLSKGKEFFGKGTPFIRYTDVYNNRSLRKKDITALVECTSDEIEKLRVSRGDVLFTRTSETAEDVGWSSVMLDDIGDCVFNGFTIRATPTTDKLLPEYCAFCFATDDFRDYVTRNCAFTTRASLTGKTIADYKLAVPPIPVQQKIASFLENFEAICTDLNIGLPAEIEVRQKQYEFYRDQLLTFTESGKTILTTGRPDDRTTGRPDDRTTGRPDDRTTRHGTV